MDDIDAGDAPVGKPTITYSAPIKMPREAKLLPPGDYPCVVRIVVNAHGVPTSATPTSCPEPFRAAAVAGAMRYRFSAVFDAAGIPMPSTFDLRVLFRIEPDIEPPRTRLGVSGGLAVLPPPERGRPLRDGQLLGHLGLVSDGILLDVAVGTRGGGLYAATELGVWADDLPVRFVVGARLGMVSTTASRDWYGFGAAPLGVGIKAGEALRLTATADPELDVGPDGVRGWLMVSVGLGIELKPRPQPADP